MRKLLAEQTTRVVGFWYQPQHQPMTCRIGESPHFTMQLRSAIQFSHSSLANESAGQSTIGCSSLSTLQSRGHRCEFPARYKCRDRRSR